MTALSPSKTKDFIITALKCNQIPYVSGQPGIGKSDVVHAVGKEFNAKVIDIRLSQMLPEDLTGLPRFDEKTNKATYTPFDTFPMVGDKVPDGYNGWIVFLDELSSASEEVMAAIYSLLLGHRIGGKLLHKKVKIVAAGNRSTDSAIARPLPDTLITRLLPCEMKVSVKDWLEWAISQNNARQEVVNFIEKFPDSLISTSNPHNRAELETYPTPRGWGKVFDILNQNDIIKKETSESNLSKGLLPVTMALLTSAVGSITAQAFNDYYNEAVKIPFPWEVAQSPTSTKIPADAIGRADLVEELAGYYEKNIINSGDSVLTYMNRLPSEDKAMFVTVLDNIVADNQSGLTIMKKVKERLGIVINQIPVNNAQGQPTGSSNKKTPSSASPIMPVSGLESDTQDPWNEEE